MQFFGRKVSGQFLDLRAVSVEPFQSERRKLGKSLLERAMAEGLSGIDFILIDLRAAGRSAFASPQ